MPMSGHSFLLLSSGAAALQCGGLAACIPSAAAAAVAATSFSQAAALSVLPGWSSRNNGGCRPCAGSALHTAAPGAFQPHDMPSIALEDTTNGHQNSARRGLIARAAPRLLRPLLLGSRPTGHVGHSVANPSRCCTAAAAPGAAAASTEASQCSHLTRGSSFSAATTSSPFCTCSFCASRRSFATTTTATPTTGPVSGYPGPTSVGGSGGPGFPLPGMGGQTSHGPAPGLPLDPAAAAPPLQRPDRLGRPQPGGPLGPAADPVNIAADHEHQGDPRDILHRVILHSVTAVPPWTTADEDDTASAVASEGGMEGDGAPEEQLLTRGSAAPLGRGGGLGVPDLTDLPERRPGPLGGYHPDQLHRLSGPDLAALALALMPSLPPPRVAQLAVALARLGHFDTAFKNALVEHVVGRIYQFTPQQLSDVAWAVAACGYYDLPFLEALAERLRATAPQWDARSLAKVIWSFGVFHFVGPEPPVGSEALEAMVEKLQSDMDGDTLSEVVFAAGQLCGGGLLNWRTDRLTDMVADFARQNMTTFGPESLGKLSAGLLGLGLGGLDSELGQRVAGRAAELAPRLEPEDVCRIMDFLSTFGRLPAPWMEALAARAAELAVPVGPPELVTPGGGTLEGGTDTPASAATAARRPRLGPDQAAILVSHFNALGHASQSVLALASRAYSGAPIDED